MTFPPPLFVISSNSSWFSIVFSCSFACPSFHFSHWVCGCLPVVMGFFHHLLCDYHDFVLPHPRIVLCLSVRILSLFQAAPFAFQQTACSTLPRHTATIPSGSSSFIISGGSTDSCFLCSGQVLFPSGVFVSPLSLPTLPFSIQLRFSLPGWHCFCSGAPTVFELKQLSSRVPIAPSCSNGHAVANGVSRVLRAELWRTQWERAILASSSRTTTSFNQQTVHVPSLKASMAELPNTAAQSS